MSTRGLVDVEYLWGLVGLGYYNLSGTGIEGVSPGSNLSCLG